MDRSAAMKAISRAAMATEYEFCQFLLPRTTSRRAARQLLTERAEHGHWELDRLRLFPDGTRRVVLRRKIMRVRSTI